MRRLVVAVTILVVTMAAPPGAASFPTTQNGDCTISLADPTNPSWSDDCTEPPDLEDIGNATRSQRLIVSASPVADALQDETDLCSTDVPCDELLGANVSAVVDAEETDSPLEVSASFVVAGEEAEASVDGDGCEVSTPVSDLVQDPCETVDLS